MTKLNSVGFRCPICGDEYDAHPRNFTVVTTVAGELSCFACGVWSRRPRWWNADWLTLATSAEMNRLDPLARD